MHDYLVTVMTPSDEIDGPVVTDSYAATSSYAAAIASTFMGIKHVIYNRRRRKKRRDPQ